MTGGRQGRPGAGDPATASGLAVEIAELVRVDVAFVALHGRDAAAGDAECGGGADILLGQNELQMGATILRHDAESLHLRLRRQPLDRLDEAFRLMQERPDGFLKAVVRCD